jgi:hypothetical protein
MPRPAGQRDAFWRLQENPSPVKVSETFFISSSMERNKGRKDGKECF